MPATVKPSETRLSLMKPRCRDWPAPAWDVQSFWNKYLNQRLSVETGRVDDTINQTNNPVSGASG